MGRTLYIFIDESGNITQHDYYGLAACWVVSRENNFTRVLDPTVQVLSDTAEAAYRDSRSISELHGTQLAQDVLEVVFESLDNAAYDDTTIPHTNTPWQVNPPVRYSISTINPSIGADALANLAGHKLDSPKAMKVMLLISALDPLFRDDLVDPERYTNTEVILDATVWDGPAEHAQRAIDETPLQNPVSFSTEDSVRTPGLQLADIAVYSWCRHLREGDCGTIVETIDRYRFSDK